MTAVFPAGAYSIFSSDFPTAGVFILEPRPGTAEGLNEGACSLARVIDEFYACRSVMIPDEFSGTARLSTDWV
jgi:hypothetical protein